MPRRAVFFFILCGQVLFELNFSKNGDGGPRDAI